MKVFAMVLLYRAFEDRDHGEFHSRSATLSRVTFGKGRMGNKSGLSR
jgi:hypothetical protein